MKKLSLLTIFWAWLMVPSVFAADPINNSIFGSVAIDGYDTVSYWTENRAVEGKKKFSYEWKGANWRFSSKENLDMFAANPSKYAPEYGGYCAWAMSDGKFASIDGEAFTMHNGKLYLNYNKNVMKEWRADKDRFISEADVHYPKKIDG